MESQLTGDFAAAQVLLSVVGGPPIASRALWRGVRVYRAAALNWVIEPVMKCLLTLRSLNITASSKEERNTTRWARTSFKTQQAGIIPVQDVI